MTVQPWSGAVAEVHRGGAAGPARSPAPAPARFEQIPLWTMHEVGEGHDALLRQALEHGWERLEWQESSGGAWFALEGRSEWESPHVVTSWEAGPFAYPVEVLPPSREAWAGRTFAWRVGGVTHVVYGPWRVVIRNLGRHAERAVHGAWTIVRSWAVEGGHTLRAGPVGVPHPGASERLLLGASERRWLAASELRLGGASEVWRIGASELRYRGASETLLRGRQPVEGARRERATAARRQRAPAGRRQRAVVRGRQRAPPGRSQRAAPRRRRQRAQARSGPSPARSSPTPPRPVPGERSDVDGQGIPRDRPPRAPALRPPPGRPDVMEERWLYEAITGTYLPLLQVFEGLVADGVPYPRAPSRSRRRSSRMLTDDLLKVRYAAPPRQADRAGGEGDRPHPPEPHYQRLAQMYRDRFQSLRHTWRCHDGNLVPAFRRLQDAGRLEVITSTATHAFFPLMDRNWAAIRAQVHVAADLYEKHFGRRPRGMWLGECGYVPGVDELLREAAIRYFFVDTHGLLYADRAARLRRPTRRSTAGRASRPSPATSSRRSRSGARRKATRAIRTTATSTATSASTCRWTTSAPTSTPTGTASTPASSTTRSPTTSCTTSGSTIRTPRAGAAGEHATHFRENREQAGGAPGGRHGPPAARGQPLRRRALRPLVVRGAALPERPLPPAPPRPGARSRRITPGDYLERHPTNQVATPASRPGG